MYANVYSVVITESQHLYVFVFCRYWLQVDMYTHCLLMYTLQGWIQGVDYGL